MTITRKHLCQSLQDVGFTYRESRQLVKAIFEILTAKLKETSKLELPFGEMTLIQPTPKRQYRLNKIVRTYTKPRVHFRSKHD